MPYDSAECNYLDLFLGPKKTKAFYFHWTDFNVWITSACYIKPQSSGVNDGLTCFLPFMKPFSQIQDLNDLYSILGRHTNRKGVASNLFDCFLLLQDICVRRWELQVWWGAGAAVSLQAKCKVRHSSAHLLLREAAKFKSTSSVLRHCLFGGWR